MSLANEIRNEIENIKELKITVGDINNHLSVLEGLTRKDIEEREKEAYQRGFDDAHRISEEEYQRGLDDAWEAARKIVCTQQEEGLGRKMLDTMFGDALDRSEIMFTYSAQEAIDKIKAYEDKQKDRIEVGDEVVWNDGTTLTVTRVHKLDDDEWCDGMDEDGRMYGVLKNNVRKTGKHYDIASILEAMRT